MKWLFRLFLSLSFLLSYGYAFVHADTLQVNSSLHSAQATYNRLHAKDTVKLTTGNNSKKVRKVYAEEAEDDSDEVVNYRKQLDKGTCLAALFYIQLTGFLSTAQQSSLPVEPVSDAPTNKIYRTLQVFRI
ncbi:hypothetical protein FPZ43_11665 [Mucilaginibacter pallidiroseus]|uniref:Uncharacterized protein n=1 Tax=Mucilaginibacter pallidiroseus TaxID=2599295 RepID=A0A563UC66_9SPHI|nr:hypothetical protein [Mucilaginibacter pallidiroseus]TWR28916.1 hypothetical protein FPZ43_11665 [Mucilaginibacter pallidiroseus]